MGSEFAREARSAAWVNSLSQLKQVSPRCWRQPQHVGYPTKRCAGGRYLLSLLKPRIPSRTDPGQLGNFFAPKTRCSPPSFTNLLVVGRYDNRLSVLAQKLAKRPLSYGRMYRRIFCTSIVALRVPQHARPAANRILNHKLDDDNFDNLGRPINLPNVVV